MARKGAVITYVNSNAVVRRSFSAKKITKTRENERPFWRMYMNWCSVIIALVFTFNLVLF